MTVALAVAGVVLAGVAVLLYDHGLFLGTGAGVSVADDARSDATEESISGSHAVPLVEGVVARDSEAAQVDGRGPSVNARAGEDAAEASSRTGVGEPQTAETSANDTSVAPKECDEPGFQYLKNAVSGECGTCHVLCDWSKGCTGDSPSACNRCDFEMFGRGPKVEWQMNRIVDDGGTCKKTPDDRAPDDPEWRAMQSFWVAVFKSIYEHGGAALTPYPPTAAAPWEQLWEESPEAPWAGVIGGPMQDARPQVPPTGPGASGDGAPHATPKPTWRPRPGRKCIFFTHMPPPTEKRPPEEQRLTVMAACAVESALRFNPDMDVCMLSNVLPEAVHQRIALDVSPDDPERFRIVPFDFLTEADGNGDPVWSMPRMRELYESNAWRKGDPKQGNSPGMLLSDAM